MIHDGIKLDSKMNRTPVFPPKRTLFLALNFILLQGMFSLPTLAETTTTVGGQTRVFIPLQSMKALSQKGMVMQAFDYSCGAAAMATLLTYGLGDSISEKEVLDQVLEALSDDQEAVRKKDGLSLLDLQKVAHLRGHQAEGFRLTPDILQKLEAPVLVYIKPRGYDHFAILKGIVGDRAYLADPSLGNVRMPVYEFLDMWLDENGKGVIFVVERTDGSWPNEYPLQVSSSRSRELEILSTRQLYQVGNLKARMPQLLNLTP